MPPELHRFNVADADFGQRFNAFVSEAREVTAEVDGVVAAIMDDVRQRGDAALIEHTRRLDRHQLDAASIGISADEIETAIQDCDVKALEALHYAADRIRAFHEKQKPDDVMWTDEDGVTLGWRWTSLATIGLYVPGGTAAYPSSVLMNAIPAKVAGVERLVVTVPTPDGVINPLVMAALRIAGVDEVYRVGGAQAIAALAYGTATIRPVDKIVGPGNAYVASAKRQVFGTVGLDTIAGPSEITVVSDARNDPAWIAADLLSQAEHDTLSQSILITDDAAYADRVAAAVETHLAHLPRREIAGESWHRFGAIVVVRDLAAAPALIDQIAPEHLELAIDDAQSLARRVRNAGSIFLGRHTPEAIGDYVGGPNHVLPTSRAARFASGLGVHDFIKRTSLLGCDPKALSRLGPQAMVLARAEGFDAHALSIAVRLNAR